MDQGSQDRNLPASERKLKKARDDGQVGRSQDLLHLAVLGSGAMAVLVLAHTRLRVCMVSRAVCRSPGAALLQPRPGYLFRAHLGRDRRSVARATRAVGSGGA